jgi:hypothetical protein
MHLSAEALDEQVRIPDLLRAAPGVRLVLDRYGLRGCGGPDGPHETLGFFARAHDVPVEKLLGELRAEMDLPVSPAEVTAGPAHGVRADTIYRPFFTAGIAVVLTLGAAWGAYLLLRIGWRGDFTAAGLHQVNAHGHAQIFGWVGLFVMGFAYQAFPRFKHTELATPRLAHASLWLMLAGLVGRSVCQPLAGDYPGLWWPAVAASLLEVTAILLFANVLALTWRRSGKPLAFYDGYIVSALAWFVIQAVYESVYLTATLSAAGRDELLGLVKTWQGPLREIQIHGFALLMILGVSQRLFHPMYGLPAPNPRRSQIALAGLNVAVAGEAVGLILMSAVGHGWAALWYASVLLLAGMMLWLLTDWRIFSPPHEADRSLKFLRTAYVWLGVSLAMQVLLPVYQWLVLPLFAPDGGAAAVGFSHAYYGAIRHAVTVGFVSLMIVGVAAKVVPTLNGVDVRSLPGLWGPFVLLNLGCALRVSAQTLTDFTAVAFPVAGVSGLLEVTGLAWWGLHLVMIMRGGARVEASSATRLSADEPIHAAHRVGEVLHRYPHLLPTFLAFGFTPLANPRVRQTLARRVTIGWACRFGGVDCRRLLETLNRERRKGNGPRLSLPLMDKPF